MKALNSDSTLLPSVSVPDIELLKLQITVKWRRANPIPGPIIANVLRGAVAITFRRLVCPEQYFHDECLPCPLYANCAYGQVFAPTPPADATQLRLQQDLPRPFVLEPPGLNPDHDFTAERLTFQLILFGTAIHWLPFFITTLERLGWDGMGPSRIPFDIEQVTALHPAGNETLFASGDSTLHLPQRRIITNDLISASSALLSETPPGATSAPTAERSDAPAPPLYKGGPGVVSMPIDSPLPPNHNTPLRQRLQARMGLNPEHTVPSKAQRHATGPRIRIMFRTPMLLKSGSHKAENGRIIPAKEIRNRPQFGVLARRLRDRLSALCLFFGEPWHHPNFAALGERSDAVQLVHSDTVWLTRTRTSTRTGQTHEISGFIGEADYEFPTPESLAEFRPLLQLGQYLHIGKNAPWGNGRINIILL